MKRLIYTLEKVFRIKIYTVIYEVKTLGKVQCPRAAKRPTKVRKTFSITGMNKYGWTEAKYMNHNILVLS